MAKPITTSSADDNFIIKWSESVHQASGMFKLLDTLVDPDNTEAGHLLDLILRQRAERAAAKVTRRGGAGIGA